MIDNKASRDQGIGVDRVVAIAARAAACSQLPAKEWATRTKVKRDPPRKRFYCQPAPHLTEICWNSTDSIRLKFKNRRIYYLKIKNKKYVKN
jgi:hypothetical protein